MSSEQIDFLAIARGLAGAAIGGAIGFFAFNWLASQGVFALALPGALLGGGCGLMSRIRSVPLAVICLILGFLLSVFCEWWNWPMVANDSFGYFLKNFHKTDSMTILFAILGTLIAGWFGYGREYLSSPAKNAPSE